MVQGILKAFYAVLADPNMPYTPEARKGVLNEPNCTAFFTSGLVVGHISVNDKATWRELKDHERRHGTDAVYEIVLATVRDGFTLLKKQHSTECR